MRQVKSDEIFLSACFHVLIQWYSKCSINGRMPDHGKIPLKLQWNSIELTFNLPMIIRIWCYSVTFRWKQEYSLFQYQVSGIIHKCQWHISHLVRISLHLTWNWREKWLHFEKKKHHIRNPIEANLSNFFNLNEEQKENIFIYRYVCLIYISLPKRKEKTFLSDNLWKQLKVKSYW